VLDVTSFLSQHPGGELAILTFAGKDATEEFNMIHPPDVIPKYAPDAVIGVLGEGGGGAAAAAAPAAKRQRQQRLAHGEVRDGCSLRLYHARRRVPHRVRFNRQLHIPYLGLRRVSECMHV
jgi:hypothetical protein